MGTMDIDENAPVITRDEILIDAPLSTVWGLHTAISSWSEWLPDIASSTIEGPLEVGMVFRWETFGLSIESTIREIEPPRRIVWSGPAQGITAIHVWTMTPSVAAEPQAQGGSPRYIGARSGAHIQDGRPVLLSYSLECLHCSP